MHCVRYQNQTHKLASPPTQTTRVSFREKQDENAHVRGKEFIMGRKKKICDEYRK